jgi:hypothetical protein
MTIKKRKLKGLARLSIFIFEATVDRLDVAEDTLPVRLLIHHHVVNIEEWRNSGFIAENRSK